MYTTFIVDLKVILSYTTWAIYSFQQVELRHMDVHSQKNELQPLLCTILVYIYSKWILELNVKPEIIQLLVENTVENICDPGLGKDFLEHKTA